MSFPYFNPKAAIIYLEILVQYQAQIQAMLGRMMFDFLV